MAGQKMTDRKKRRTISGANRLRPISRWKLPCAGCEVESTVSEKVGQRKCDTDIRRRATVGQGDVRGCHRTAQARNRIAIGRCMGKRCISRWEAVEREGAE